MSGQANPQELQQLGAKSNQALAETIANLYKKKVLKEMVDVPVQNNLSKDADVVLKTLAENIGRVP